MVRLDAAGNIDAAARTAPPDALRQPRSILHRPPQLLKSVPTADHAQPVRPQHTAATPTNEPEPAKHRHRQPPPPAATPQRPQHGDDPCPYSNQGPPPPRATLEHPLMSNDTATTPAEPEPDAPDTKATPRAERTLGGRVRGHSDIVAGKSATIAAPAPAPARSSTRRARNLSLPPGLAERAIKSGLNRRDLVLLAAQRYRGHIGHIPREKVEGRVGFQVRLSDKEHARLREIAAIRGWSLSSTVAFLITLYLDEFDENNQTPPPRK